MMENSVERPVAADDHLLEIRIRHFLFSIYIFQYLLTAVDSIRFLEFCWGKEEESLWVGGGYQLVFINGEMELFVAVGDCVREANVRCLLR